MMNNLSQIFPSLIDADVRALAAAGRLLAALNRAAVLQLSGESPGEMRGRAQVGTSTPPPEDPDRDIRALRRLDPEAITRVHDLYFEDVYRFARYRLSDEVLAEDIAAETFKRLIEYAHRGRGPDKNIRGWLMRTASNLANDYYRAVYNRPTEELPETMASDNLGPAGVFESDEEKRELHEALKKLTEDQVNVLALRFGSGFSLAETAEALGKKVNAIKALQFRAVSALRRELVGYDGS